MNGPTVPAGFEPMEYQHGITVALLLLCWLGCALVDALGRKSRGNEPMRAFVRKLVLCHLILGPWGVYILAHDARHPELWGTWFRDPRWSIPFCVCLELFIVGIAAHARLHERRRSKGISLLREALRLQAEGNHEAAEAAYRKGLKLMSLKPER